MLAEGSLLIAHPMLADPNFMRSVVYILEHNSNGSLGLICNRPLDITLKDVWEDCPSDVAETQICAEGGPVARDRGLLLHGHTSLKGSHPISTNIQVGGDNEALYQLHKSGSPLQGPRLFLGHSGWGTDQLENEIANGSWLVRSGHPNVLLNPEPPEDLWSNLVNCGPENPEPSLN